VKNSRAFTIVELLISVALIGLIVVYLYSVSGNLQKSNQFYDEKQQKEEFENQIKELFFRDIMEIASNDINITAGFGKEYSILKFKTHNSLYGLANPYVMYAVSREDSTLLRSESMDDFNFTNETFFNRTKNIEIAKNVKKFLVTSDIKKKKLLFFLQADGENSIYLEVLRIADYSRKVTDSNTSSSSSKSSSGDSDTPPAMPSSLFTSESASAASEAASSQQATPALPGIPTPGF